MAIAAQFGARLFDLRSHAFRPPMQRGKPVFDVAFAPDSSAVCFANGTQRLVLQDPAGSSPPLLASKAHASLVQSVAFSEDGRTVLSADSDGFIHRWDRQTLSEAPDLWKASGSIARLLVHPDGHSVLAANWEGTLTLWDLSREHATSEPLPIEQAPGVGAIALASGGRWLISAGYDKSVALWDMTARRRIRWLARDGEFKVLSVDTSPDGKMVAARDGGRRLLAARLDEDAVLARQPVPFEVVSNVVFIDTPGVLTFGTSAGLVEWDLAGSKEIARHALSQGKAVVDVAFSAAGHLLAASDRSGAVELFDSRDLAPKGRWTVEPGQSPTTLAFNADGTYLTATGDDGSICSWEVSSHQLLWRVDGHIAGAVSLAVSPAGDMLATGDQSGALRFWDPPTGQQIGPALAANAGAIDAVAFTPDGRALSSAGRDGRIRLWDVSFEAWISRACALAGRNLSKDEAKQFLAEEVSPINCTVLATQRPTSLSFAR
jgi:WD40 repeat protein